MGTKAEPFSVLGMVSADRGWRAIFLSRSHQTDEVVAVYLKTIVGWAWGKKEDGTREIHPVVLDFGSPFVVFDDGEYYGCLAPGQNWDWAELEGEGVNGVFEWLDRPGFEPKEGTPE